MNRNFIQRRRYVYAIFILLLTGLACLSSKPDEIPLQPQPEQVEPAQIQPEQIQPEQPQPDEIQPDPNQLDEAQPSDPTAKSPQLELTQPELTLNTVDNPIVDLIPPPLDIPPIVATVRNLTDLERMRSAQTEFIPGEDIDLDQDLPYHPDLKQLGGGKSCQPVPFQADLVDQDGNDEIYSMISLLECNGENLVSPVRQQEGGTCGTYSTVAALELTLGAMFSNVRPVTPDHPIDDFFPINLSEGYRLYSNYIYYPYASVLTGPDDHNWMVSTHASFFPIQSSNGVGENGMTGKPLPLSSHYNEISDYCKDIVEPQLTKVQLDRIRNEDTLDKDEKRVVWSARYHPIFNCLWDAAKQQELVFVGSHLEYTLPGNRCVDTQAGIGDIPCELPRHIWQCW